MINLSTAEIALLNEVSKISNIPVYIDYNSEYKIHYVNFGEGSKVINLSSNSKKPSHYNFYMNRPQNKEHKIVYFDSEISFNSFNISKDSSPERIAKALKKLWEDPMWEKILMNVERDNNYLERCENTVQEYKDTFKDFIKFESNNEKFRLNTVDGTYFNARLSSNGSISLEYMSLPKDIAMEVITMLQKYSK